tara:strand:- start:12718 stop:13869 length:1152 start_codon:yes stop_codon:yes gene_type:complete
VCNEDEYVLNNECIPCPDGFTRPGGDPQNGQDTLCFEWSWSEPGQSCDQKCSLNSLTCAPQGRWIKDQDDFDKIIALPSMLDGSPSWEAAAAAGQVMPGVDATTGQITCAFGITDDMEDPSGAESSSPPAFNTGRPWNCYSGVGGDGAAHGSRTSECSASSDVFMRMCPCEVDHVTPCTENHHVSNHRCIPCSDGTVRDAGDDPNGGDTECLAGAVINTWIWSDAGQSCTDACAMYTDKSCTPGTWAPFNKGCRIGNSDFGPCWENILDEIDLGHHPNLREPHRDGRNESIFRDNETCGGVHTSGRLTGGVKGCSALWRGAGTSYPWTGLSPAFQYSGTGNWTPSGRIYRAGAEGETEVVVDPPTWDCDTANNQYRLCCCGCD